MLFSYFCVFGNPNFISNSLVTELNNIKYYLIYSLYLIYTTRKNIGLNFSLEDV